VIRLYKEGWRGTWYLCAWAISDVRDKRRLSPFSWRKASFVEKILPSILPRERNS
jgi:hypothetical protein